MYAHNRRRTGNNMKVTGAQFDEFHQQLLDVNIGGFC
jgi:hypothetical protein